jgi:hypothetical protein
MIKKSQALYVFAILLSGIFCQAKTALGADAFEIKGIFVDVTAENVTAARKQAMREGEERAFKILLKRLTLKADYDFLPFLEPTERAQYVKDFSVSGEKTSAVRYLGTLSYHFKDDAIRNLLKSRNLAFAETFSKPVLVIPLYEVAARKSIWDEPNPWSSAWSRLRNISNGLVPLALPLGDLADISGLSASQAAEGNETALINMANRYGSNGVVVAQMIASQTGDRVDLVINRIGGKNAGRTTLLGLQKEINETQELFFQRVATLVTENIEEAWKKDNILQFGQTGVLPVNLRIKGLNEWLSVKKRLNGVAVVRKVELALLSRDTVQLNLHFIGDLDQLITSLRQIDLDLTVQGESWALINLKEGNPS